MKKVLLLCGIILLLTACVNSSIKNQDSIQQDSISLGQADRDEYLKSAQEIKENKLSQEKDRIKDEENKELNNNKEKNMATEKVLITMQTNKGDIELELYEKAAPITVANFLKLIKEDYYNDIKFHRVIGDFMIQTGDPQSKGKVNVDFVYDAGNNPKNLPIAGTGGPGYSFKDEFNNGYVFDKAGILAMANSGPNTNGSQIFITHLPTPHLNNKHTIFGQVISGMDIVNAIEQTDVIEGIIIK